MTSGGGLWWGEKKGKVCGGGKRGGGGCLTGGGRLWWGEKWRGRYGTRESCVGEGKEMDYGCGGVNRRMESVG